MFFKIYFLLSGVFPKISSKLLFIYSNPDNDAESDCCFVISIPVSNLGLSDSIYFLVSSGLLIACSINLGSLINVATTSCCDCFGKLKINPMKMFRKGSNSDDDIYLRPNAFTDVIYKELG